MTPKLHRSQRLSQMDASSLKASMTSGAMYSAEPHGGSSSGWRWESQSPFILIPLPKSKSQILTEETWSGLSQRLFSGFKSLCAIPLFIVQEIKGTGDIVDHHAGLQFVEMALAYWLLDFFAQL